MTMNLQPTLRGSLVELRPLRADDWESLFAVASDPLIWAQHPASDRYQEEVFREFFRAALATGSAFVVVAVDSGQIIGSTRFHGHDEVAQEIEIGWTFLARDHWGGRYNGEMKQLLLNHAFQFVDRVIFVIGPHNIRSQRAVQQIGAVLDGARMIREQPSVVYVVHKPVTPSPTSPH